MRPRVAILGERYRRIVKRRGKLKALVAVARCILVIVWHLLADPTARFHDLGPDYHSTRVNTDHKIRNLVHQLEAVWPGFPSRCQPLTFAGLRWRWLLSPGVLWMGSEEVRRLLPPEAVPGRA